ncbi:[NiFe] hydrogenase large subunit [Desulfonatronum thiosulfatophilum]|uniref:[NiFe] hydrogenase large subunit n=1 Tax=Desulfonatronum thiosulfatophilum TaxID=617002 RepID=A0A1G6CHY5_9BACT|nr:nickel-dependent hydrogenase large subunit [Desulfonatronum thiosulfatophilum]SDB32372.1 [NiFe] hydrogenase large subunit [Desulfonatronum thiosulfatophilum]
MSGCKPQAAPVVAATPQSTYSGPIVVDPLTRIEGHLRLEVEVDNGKVVNARSSSQLYRGLETILKGRDPRDAQHFTQRACGVCTYTHALASVRCLDDAVGVEIPDNARLIRNLVLASQFMVDHLIHFYVLHALDWVDVTSALQADPIQAAKIANNISPRPTSADDLKAVQTRLAAFVEQGQLGIFTNADFLGGHPAYYLPPEVNLIGTAHYLEALGFQIKASRAMAVFGGKVPHTQFTISGGVTCYDALRPERLEEYRGLYRETRQFIEQVYIPDLLAIASYYKDWAGIGGCTNYLSFGEFPKNERDLESRWLPPGVIMNRDLANVQKVDPNAIYEHVAASWYEGTQARHPYDGVTEPKYTSLDDKQRYSWSKAPRYMDEPMEVGPLASVLVAYAKGHPETKAAVDMVLNHLGVGPEALHSTLGRTAARGIKALTVAQKNEDWLDELVENVKSGNTKLVVDHEMPDEAEGVGFADVSRGALSHWIKIKGGKIENFQLVVPSTWNLGPRCDKGKLGPVEEALIDTPIADPKRPVELLRTVHSFDPCIACGVHVIDSRTNQVHEFKIL